MKNQSIVVIKCRAKPGQGETALKAFEALIATVKENESDCISITLHQGDDDPEQLMLYERWSSREAYQSPHMQTPYIQKFIESSMAFLNGPPEITFWRDMDT